MPHEQMTEQQVAQYLGMTLKEVVRLASREKIPCRPLGDQQFRFRKAEVDHWVWQQMHDFDHSQLAEIERGVGAHHGFEVDRPLICPLIPDGGVAMPLGAKTRQAALRRLLDTADACGLVYVYDELLAELTGRESLCSTALLPGVAIPYPRHPLPWDIARSFVIVGLCPPGLPFGAEDGSLTRLFFLTCCKDERTHLHVLARLVRILEPGDTIDRLIAAESSQVVAELLAHRELEVIGHAD